MGFTQSSTKIQLRSIINAGTANFLFSLTEHTISFMYHQITNVQKMRLHSQVTL